jgi:hypothetical protein
MPTPNDFSDFRFRPNENQRGGDFSPAADAPPAPEVEAGAYPNVRNYGFDPMNSQFTSREEFATEAQSVPEILLEQTKPSIKAHADLNESYGLRQPEATLGSHPWLRDSLADPSEKEPGNASPTVDKTPFSGAIGQSES